VSEASERTKYERMWQHDQYRRQAPGESLVKDAINALGMQTGDTVIDFGCGTGRPAVRLQQAGLDVIGVDFADNCLDPDVAIPFRRECLWDMPAIKADWGFCTDVMEHIPRERVLQTLASIRRCTRKGVFFQIATRPDNCGKLIGETLHLTVKPPHWWHTCLRIYWDPVDLSENRAGIQAASFSSPDAPVPGRP